MRHRNLFCGARSSVRHRNSLILWRTAKPCATKTWWAPHPVTPNHWFYNFYGAQTAVRHRNYFFCGARQQCATKIRYSVAHCFVCATEISYSVAHCARCATEISYSVAHCGWCATELANQIYKSEQPPTYHTTQAILLPPSSSSPPSLSYHFDSTFHLLGYLLHLLWLILNWS